MYKPEPVHMYVFLLMNLINLRTVIRKLPVTLFCDKVDLY